MARSGSGSELFAESPDDTIAAMAAEVDGLLQQAVQAASLLVRMSPVCRSVQLMNDLPANMTPEGLVVELGTFWSGEQRKIVMTLDVPGIPALGLAGVAELELTSVELPGLVESTVSLPVFVNVLPGDQLKRRVPDVVVRSELLFQKTQQAKRRATGHLTSGSPDLAMSELRHARDLATEALAINPREPSLGPEVDAIAGLMRETGYGDVGRAAKLSSADVSAKSRRRGRFAS